jgi:hypothetical protein
MQIQNYNKDGSTTVTQTAEEPAKDASWNFDGWCQNNTSATCTVENATTTVNPVYNTIPEYYGKFSRTITFKS